MTDSRPTKPRPPLPRPNPASHAPANDTREDAIADSVNSGFWEDFREGVEVRLKNFRRGMRARWSGHEIGHERRSRSEMEASLKPGFDSFRVWILLFLLSTLFLGLGVEFGGRFGLVLGFIASLTLNLWILFFSPRQILNRYTLWYLEGRDAWGLLEETRRAADRAKVQAPLVALADSDQLFSFSIGISPSRSTLVISHALAEALTREERSLVVAYETAKIACQWTASATAARGLASAFSPILGPLFSKLIIFLSLGRERVFRLDEWVAAHGDSREIWARTLWSLDSMVGSKPRRTNVAECALDTVSSLTAFHAPRYDRTLPSVRSRIQTLIDRYPP